MDEPPVVIADDREVRVVGFADMEVAHSGRATEGFTLRGYPAVYNQTSHDLGGFREQIAPGAFDEVLATEPDVHFVWDHDTRYVGARTTNGTLKLESDSTGLFITAHVGNYSWAKDLRVALERGDISQGSFAFNVAEGGDEFATDDDGNVMRTINKIGALYDVTATAQGAYPQTSLAAVRSLAAVTGHSPEQVKAALVTPDEGQGDEEADAEFAMHLELLTKRFDRRKETLAKLQERLGKLR